MRNHFSLHVQERIVQLGTQVLDGGLSRYDAGQLFARELGPSLGQSQSYWAGFANHVTTRSAEFGRVDAYEAVGAERYQIVSVVDKRRSEVCRIMHGKTFPVSAMAGVRDELMAASQPEDVKGVSPWLSAEEIAGMSEDELIAAGFVMPPFHWSCRSRTVVFTG